MTIGNFRVVLTSVRASQIELEFGSVGFSGKGKTGVPGEKTSRSKGENQQSEAKCEAIDMEITFHSHTYKTHFHKRKLLILASL